MFAAAKGELTPDLIDTELEKLDSEVHDLYESYTNK
jgi:hypothetical protein